MEKYLSIPVVGRPNFLLSATDVVLVDQKSATKTVVVYQDQMVASITHEAVSPTTAETVAVYIRAKIQQILQKPWQITTIDCDSLTLLVTDIDYAPAT